MSHSLSFASGGAADTLLVFDTRALVVLADEKYLHKTRVAKVRVSSLEY